MKETAMPTSEQLLIRACKSQDRLRRLHRTYRRVCGETKNENYHIACLLSAICDQYNLITISNMLTAMHPSNGVLYGVVPDDDYWTMMMKILSACIRMTETSKLIGFKEPLRYVKLNRVKL